MGLALAAQGKMGAGPSPVCARPCVLNPDLLPIRIITWGWALAAQGKMDQAMAHYAEALRLKPVGPGPITTWGLPLAGQGRMDQAMAHYAEALAS